MYVQQRDEYLESVCEMAIRKVSIITIFGSLTNSTMKIDHYQLGMPSLISVHMLSTQEVKLCQRYKARVL